MTTVFDGFPGDAYLRIFAAERDLTGEEEARLGAALTEFFRGWEYHDQPLRGAFEILHHRFVVVGADESRVKVGGCSKDALIGLLREAGASMGVDFIHGPPIHYRDREGRIHATTREGFGELVAKNEVDGQTPVFDLTLHRIESYRSGGFEMPAGECWHARAWDLTAADPT